jgi:uncharacterized protein DUF1549/uncharacterized protein DUF1553/cytochrome c
MTNLGTRSRLVLLATALGLVCGGVAADTPGEKKPASAAAFRPEDIAFFEKDVLPLLEKNCFRCHGGQEKIKANFRITSREGVLKGGDSGPAVSLKKPEESNLLKAINYKDGLEMPPDGKLSQQKIDILTKWVKAGVPWTPGKAIAVDKPKHEGGKVTPEAKQYWAYQPVKRAPLPHVKNQAWVKTPIDAFVLAKLEAKGLAPAAPAERVALTRRIYYDLIGLPPTPEEIDAFVNDKSPDAYERLIDKLLASPHYGEKWGRHWLDLVRYAETNGYERDGPKPFAWRYRDYVIKSFNNDKPYDQFIREQLAGDELAHRWEDEEDGGHKARRSSEELADAIIATGYYRLGLWDDEPVDMLAARYDEYDDIVATTSQVFLGMTMNCARCHDHKIDPIPQADYYKMVAFFRDVQHYSPNRDVSSKNNMTDISPPSVRAAYEKELKEREAEVARLTKEIEKIEDAAIKKMPAEDQRASEGPDRPEVVKKVPGYLSEEEKKSYNQLQKERGDLKRKRMPQQELALSVNNCEVRPPQQHILIRGNAHANGAKVEPGFPEVLGFATPVIPMPGANAKTAGRRTVLADWIASKENPETARVFVNRLWQFHFGRGIVASANDFGKFGVLPTHPELLDWLASEFINPTWGSENARAWTVKRMHKLIMLSNAYQMSSKTDPLALKADPSNEYFWRFNMRRLTAEEVRDSFLAVSGKLNLKAGGPSIYPPISKEVLAGQSRPGEGWHTTRGEEANRRSVYVHIKRSLLVPILSQHDMADTDTSCAVRYTTIVPTQSLGMLNGEFANEQAKAFAERLQKEAPNDVAAQVRRAIRLTTGRQPAEGEVTKDVAFIKDVQTKAKLSDFDALRQYCLMALNANEFVYVD